MVRITAPLGNTGAWALAAPAAATAVPAASMPRASRLDGARSSCLPMVFPLIVLVVGLDCSVLPAPLVKPAHRQDRPSLQAQQVIDDANLPDWFPAARRAALSLRATTHRA